MTISNLEKENKASLLGQYAGFVSRLIAFVVDIIIISAVLMFSTWFVSTTLEMLQINLFLKTIALKNIDSGISSNYSFRPILASIISLLFIVGYHIFFWYTVGQTPGKAIMGIRIVPLKGGKLPLWQAFLRYIGYLISGIALGIGFFWILVDDRRMGWHDRIARTCVIYAWDAHPDETFLTQAIQELTARRELFHTLIRKPRIRKQ